MNHIPPRLKMEMEADPFYRCCIFSDEHCDGKVEWHHAIIFGGKQLQKKFAIVPVCKNYHHRLAEQKDVKTHIMRVVLNRATNKELSEISKAVNYKYLRKQLNANQSKN